MALMPWKYISPAASERLAGLLCCLAHTRIIRVIIPLEKLGIMAFAEAFQGCCQPSKASADNEHFDPALCIRAYWSAVHCKV